MRWIHIADLHIGKHHEAADLEQDQQAVLAEILAIVQQEAPDGVLIAGDVYDRSLPPEWAVRMLDSFLASLTQCCPVYMISGNHDSGCRLAFASGLLSRQSLHVCGTYDGTLRPITQGDTDLYLLPYLHPAEVRRILGRSDISTMDQAVRAVLDTRLPGTGKRKLLLAHLFVTAGGVDPETCDSEQKIVGGVDSVDVSAFEGFDYVALGHIHGPQRVGRDTVRYAGTPMMYSFSEEHHCKSLCLVDTEAETPVRLIPLTAGRKMRRIQGLLQDLLQPENDPLNHRDIVLAELTDPMPQLEAQARLSVLYPSVMVRHINLQSTQAQDLEAIEGSLADPLALFDAFYKARNNGEEMSPAQRDEVARLMKLAQQEVE